jgi:hypothetical protein
VGVLGFGIAMFRASAGAVITPSSTASTHPLSKEATLLLKWAAADATLTIWALMAHDRAYPSG